MNDKAGSAASRRLDLAARAAWLYYVKSRTQDEIAAELHVSRQNVQRLVALANSERLIKFRLDHPLARCVELEQRLRDRYELRFCEVAPTDRGDGDNRIAVGISAAQVIEQHMSQKAPLTLALGTGRTMREAVRQVPSMDRPQHNVVSLVGNLTRDGQASPYDVVMRLADRVGARCYPLPMPVVAETADERRLLHIQRGYVTVTELARQAKAWIMGLGEVDWQAPLHADGFINDAELAGLMEAGAIGELLGWAFDERGKLLETGLADRISGVPPAVGEDRLTIIVASGARKARAARGALEGRLANGAIFDEALAEAVLGGA